MDYSNGSLYNNRMGKAYTYTSRPFAGIVVQDAESRKKKIQLLAPLNYAHEVGKMRVGDKVSLVITDQRPRRTEAQNRYWWGVCIPALIKAGKGSGSALETHEDIARKFLVIKEWRNSRGQICYVRRSTTELTSGQFADFITSVEEETGVAFPPAENYDLPSLAEMRSTLSTPAPAETGDGLLSSTHDQRKPKEARLKGSPRGAGRSGARGRPIDGPPARQERDGGPRSARRR